MTHILPTLHAHVPEILERLNIVQGITEALKNPVCSVNKGMHLSSYIQSTAQARATKGCEVRMRQHKTGEAEEGGKCQFSTGSPGCCL